MSFRVQLDVFYGPLDLLLHLVRKSELEIAELPLAHLTEQFLTYVEVLEQIDVDPIGDFLEVASILIEMKSRVVLPRVEELPEDAVEMPKQDLVRRLLEFKKFRDAASELEERGIEWRQRYARQTLDVPVRNLSPAEQPIQGLELWDLVSAFGRVMREKLEPPPVTSIRYDDTPQHVFMQQIYDRLVMEQQVQFSDLFPESVHKSTLVGVFLAVLELVRHRHALVEQAARYGDLQLSPGAEAFSSKPDSATKVSANPKDDQADEPSAKDQAA